MKNKKFPANSVVAALTACLAVFGLALPAGADQGTVEPVSVFKPKSGGTAVSLSFFATAIPFALALTLGHGGGGSAGPWVAAGALVLGPSLGHFYAGANTRAWTGIGIRVASLAAFWGGAAMAMDEMHGSSRLLGIGLIIGGATAVIASSLADIVDARESAWKHNLKGRGLTLNVSPIVSPRSKTVGIQAQIRF